MDKTSKRTVHHKPKGWPLGRKRPESKQWRKEKKEEEHRGVSTAWTIQGRMEREHRARCSDENLYGGKRANLKILSRNCLGEN